MNMFETSVFFLPLFAVSKVHRVLQKLVEAIEDDAVSSEWARDGADDDSQNQDGDFQLELEPSCAVAIRRPSEREAPREGPALPGTKTRPLALIN